MRVENQSTQSSNAATVMNSTEGDMFMKLLLAQLKSQDPLAPTDANQFVSQLVDFNTLGEITKIRQLVETLEVTAAINK